MKNKIIKVKASKGRKAHTRTIKPNFTQHPIPTSGLNTEKGPMGGPSSIGFSPAKKFKHKSVTAGPRTSLKRGMPKGMSNPRKSNH